MIKYYLIDLIYISLISIINNYNYFHDRKDSL